MPSMSAHCYANPASVQRFKGRGEHFIGNNEGHRASATVRELRVTNETKGRGAEIRAQARAAMFVADSGSAQKRSR